MIIDPMPSGRRLPPMETFQDAANLNNQERTTFYLSAFMFQVWISELTLAHSAELAEKPAPTDRSFQTGQAWRGFRKYFGKASDAEFPEFFKHLMEFAACDDPLAAHLLEAGVPLSIEHEITGQFLGERTPASFRGNPKQFLALLRSTSMRLCDWLDSVLQFRVFQEWHLMPDCFDPDPQKREFAYLSINQRHFELLDQRAQLHWLNHMSDTVQELKQSPQWPAFRDSSKAPPTAPRAWPTEQLDRAIIKLWPLLKRYRWSATDLLCVLRKVLNPAALAPCADETALAAYCANPLSLRYTGLNSRLRHRPEPPGTNIALRICAREPSAPSSP